MNMDIAVNHLFYGIKSGDLPRIEWSIDQGIDINGLYGEGDKITPLCYALAPQVAHGRTYEVVSLLLGRGADPNRRSPIGGMPMCLAAQKQSDGMVKLLIKYGGNVNCVGEHGFSPLFQSMSAEGDFCYVQKTLIAAGADVDFVAPNKNSCLIQAVASKKNNLVRLLLEAGADVSYMIPGKRVSALMVAVYWENEKAVALLLEHGALDYDWEYGESKSMTMAWGKNRFIADLLESYGAKTPVDTSFDEMNAIREGLERGFSGLR